MILGRTSGGSPIYYNLGRKSYSKAGKTLYACSADERHKLTKNQARSSGYRCTHCGADLKVRAQKLQEVYIEAQRLGILLK
jgi:transcription initiation factor IIE alpha subunit